MLVALGILLQLVSRLWQGRARAWQQSAWYAHLGWLGARQRLQPAPGLLPLCCLPLKLPACQPAGHRLGLGFCEV